MKQLVFDTTDATSIAHSDNVGAYLIASDGTLLTHTDVGGKKALDVRLAEGVNVEVDLSHVDDSVSLGDGTTLYTGTTVGADHGLDVNLINASIAVTATDLDIRDLAFATDSVDVSGSTLGANDGVDIGDVTINNAGGASAVNIQDGGNSITVDATDLDIRDLSHTTDSIQIGDGTDLLAVEADGSINVNIASIQDAALADTAIATAAKTLAAANTAEDIITSPLASRKYLWVRNMDNKNAYIGPTGVTVANGFPVSPGATVELRAGASIDIEFVGSTGQTPEIRTMELS